MEPLIDVYHTLGNKMKELKYLRQLKTLRDSLNVAHFGSRISLMRQVMVESTKLPTEYKNQKKPLALPGLYLYSFYYWESLASVPLFYTKKERQSKE